MAFMAVLSFSRQIFLRFYLDARMENFLRGHIGAFAAWNAVPRVILYDNLRSAVLERCGDAIRFNPALFDFAGHYRYEPRPVAVARGNEKGRVERAVRYVRDGFFAGRQFADVDDLNAQADAWCWGTAADRRCPDQDSLTVREAFAQEAPHLLKLPDNPYPVVEQVAVGRAVSGTGDRCGCSGWRSRNRQAGHGRVADRALAACRLAAAGGDGAARGWSGDCQRGWNVCAVD
jgi:hypothetical protein